MVTVMQTVQTDIAILGAGASGLSLALALADSGLSVALLNGGLRRPHGPDRSLALSLGSSRILASLGVEIDDGVCTTITQIQISQADARARVQLDSALLGEAWLGQVLALDNLCTKLEQSLQACTKVSHIDSWAISALHVSDNILTLENERAIIRTRLLVGADGGQGALGRLAGLYRAGWDHNRYACVATLTPSDAVTGVAYEHFLDSGPLALLPYQKDRYSLVWSLTPSQAGAMMLLSESDFLQQLNAHLPGGLAPMRGVSPRQFFPLAFQRQQARPEQRLALIGNAAQILHPVAGQGFNLGLRDAITLAALVKAAARRGEDIGSAALLQRFARSRQPDRRNVIAFTEGLNRLFGDGPPPLRWARTAGLALLQQSPWLKRQLAAHAAGLTLPSGSHTPALTPPRPLAGDGPGERGAHA